MIASLTELPATDGRTSPEITAFLTAVRQAAHCEGVASPENFWCDGERPRTAAADRAWTRVLKAQQLAGVRVRATLDAIPAEQRLAVIHQADALYHGIRGLLTDAQLIALDALEVPDPDPTE